MIAHASSRVGALMLSRWKKSASPGKLWIFDCAADPDSASALSPPSPVTSTILPMRRSRAMSFGAEVEHRCAVAVRSAGLIDGDVGVVGLAVFGRHRREPLQALGLIDLDAEALAPTR